MNFEFMSCFLQGNRTKKIKIGFVLHSSGLGGAERLHIELIRYLNRNGFQTYSIIPKPYRGLEVEIKKAGGNFIGLNAIEWWTDGKHLSELDVKTESETVNRIISVLEKKRIEIVVTHTGVIFQGAVAAKKIGVPHVWYLHEFLDLDHKLPVPLGKKYFSNFISNHSSQVWVNSRAIGEYFFKDSPEKFQVVYCFPEVELLSPKLVKSDSKFNIGVIGNFDGSKNQEIVIQACGELRRRQIPFNLHLIGSGGEANTLRLRNLCEKEKISESVIFRGIVKEINAIYSNLNTVIMAAKNESFGRTPMEAALFGIPVICAKSSATSEYMVNGVSGLMFDPDNYLELATSLIKLIESDDFRNSITTSAKKHFSEWKEKNYKPEVAGSLLRSLYE
jgi:glycosyltransferase involved in cell wall biosynthesis